jgi:DNA-binding LacI/PurR family transcriptional regulator
VRPGLTSVRQPLEKVATEVVTLLHAMLSRLPTEHPTKLLIPTLTVRGSS